MIVVGGGIAGLSSALAYAKTAGPGGKRTLVLEKNAVVGGCVSSFARGGFKFDTVQFAPDLRDLLDYFGVDLPMRRFEPCLARLFLADPERKTARTFEVPSSRDAFRESLRARFPAERRRVDAFFRAAAAMFGELRFLKTEPTPAETANILFRCPRLLAASPRTYHRFLAGFGIRGGELFEILDLFSAFAGLSGDRCAALMTVSAMTASLDGAWRPEGPFVRLPLALRDRLVELGGEVRTRTAVSRILVRDGAARGVELENGETLLSDCVVSTVDAKLFAEKLVGTEVLRRAGSGFERKLRNSRMSPSAFAVHLGLDAGTDPAEFGLDCGYGLLTTGGGAHGRMFDAWDRGELLLRGGEFHLGLSCSGNALTILLAPAPLGDWPALRERSPERYREEKERIADFCVDRVEEYLIPGLRRRIAARDVSSPATFARWLGSPAGSVFDLLPVPENFGKNRLRTRTPIRGLFQPKFSHGIWPSMQAGLQVADMLFDRAVMDGNARFTAPR